MILDYMNSEKLEFFQEIAQPLHGKHLKNIYIRERSLHLHGKHPKKYMQESLKKM